MRISDWSSDVCSSDLGVEGLRVGDRVAYALHYGSYGQFMALPAWKAVRIPEDRKSVVSGKSVSVRVDLGGRRLLKKKCTLHRHIDSSAIQTRPYTTYHY